MRLSTLTKLLAAAFAINIMAYPAFAEVAKNAEKTTASQTQIQHQQGFELIKRRINKKPE